MKNNLYKWTIIVLVIILVGCSKKEEALLDPNTPVSLTVWHYYDGTQQEKFDSLIREFNSTVGKEQGIHVTGVSQGDAENLETVIKDTVEASNELPDILATYTDASYEVELSDALVDLSDYLSDEELADMVEKGTEMIVTKSDKAHEYASIEFLKWFTQVEEEKM
jgi:multiple sugar transport system substrate-binding protein